MTCSMQSLFLENSGHCVTAEVVSSPSVPFPGSVRAPQPLGSAERPLVLPTGITCDPPPAIPHGTHNGSSRVTFSFGDVVTYSCASGLSLAGDASLSCSSADGQRGTWSGAAPRCQGTAPWVPHRALAVTGTRGSHGCGGTCTRRWGGSSHD